MRRVGEDGEATSPVLGVSRGNGVAWHPAWRELQDETRIGGRFRLQLGPQRRNGALADQERLGIGGQMFEQPGVMACAAAVRDAAGI